MKKKNLFTILGIIIIIVLILILIPTTKNSKKNVIKIGVISPLTGSAATYGIPAANAVELEAKLINDNGGINGKQIKLFVENGMCDSKAAINAVNKLINIDGVKIILGGHCSTESLAIAPIINKDHLIQLASLTSSSDYTNAGDYSFRNWPTSDYYVGKLADIAYQKGARNIALLYEQKEFPISSAKSFRKEFIKINGNVASEQTYLANSLDFRTYLEKIKNDSNIDSIFFASQADNSAIVYFKTLKEMGMLDKYRLFTNNEAISQKVFDETDGAIKNVYTTNVYVNPDKPKTKALINAYKKMYGKYPQTNYFYVACSADALSLIKDAVESCNDVNTVCIKNYLYGVKNWQGAAGSVTFDKNGDALTTIGLHYFDINGNEIWKELN